MIQIGALLLTVIITLLIVGCSAQPLQSINYEQRFKIRVLMSEKPDTVFFSSWSNYATAEWVNNELYKLPNKFKSNIPRLFDTDFLEILEKYPTDTESKLRRYQNIFRYVTETDPSADFTIFAKLEFAAAAKEDDLSGRDILRDVISRGLVMGLFVSSGGEAAIAKYTFLIQDQLGNPPDTLIIVGSSKVTGSQLESGLFPHRYGTTLDFTNAIKQANVQALRKFSIELMKKLNDKYGWNYKPELRYPTKEDKQRIRNLDNYE